MGVKLIYSRLTLLFVVFCYNFSLSQSYISGIITDENKIPIPHTNIFLSPTNSLNILTFTSSDKNGFYQLKIDNPSKYNLSFSYLSYKTVTIPIEVIKDKIEIKQDIQLVNETFGLKEIIIKSERPISVRNDTIIFDVKAFMQGNEIVVEDLLKKIPGLNVSSDGTIKIGNQEVEKVMVDGDDFFEKGYKILTKNMPSTSIDKVELLQRYSNNKHLKGIENSEKVALNLKLKDDIKRIWFGNIHLAYGLISENRYESKNNLMNFGKKNKYYLLSNLNNIGKDVTGELNDLIKPHKSREPGNIGDNQNSSFILNLDTQSPNLNKKRINFNNTEMLSINSIFTISNKFKIKLLGFFNADENSFYKNSFQSFLIGNTSFENTNNFQLKKNKKVTFSKIDLTYDYSDKKTLQYTGKYSYKKDINSNSLLFNNNLLGENLENTNYLIDNKLVFTNNYKQDKVFLLSFRHIEEKIPQNYTINRFLYQDLFNLSAINSEQYTRNHMQYIGFESHLLQKKNNGSLVEIILGNEFRKDLIKSIFKINDNTSTLKPINYQNDFTYIVNDTYLNTKYRFKINNLGFTTSLDFHQFLNEIKNFKIIKNNKLFLINPKVGFDWEINKNNRLTSLYSFNKTNATVLDIYSNYINTGFRSFSKGTGDFNQITDTSLLFKYTHGSWGEKYFGNIYFIYTQNRDFLSTNNFISQNYSQIDKIKINGRKSFNFISNLERYFKTISSNFKLNFGGSLSNYKNIVNNSNFREIKSTNFNYGLGLRSGFSGFFNFDIGTNWLHNNITITQKNSFTNNNTFLDLFFVVNENFNIQIQSERYHFGNLNKQNNTYYFTDLEAKFTPKKNQINFSITGNNLFNTRIFKDYSISDVDISKTEYKLQPRFFLLKVEYKF